MPDQPAIGKTFDYVVPPALADDVRIGTMVRVVLHGRRVGGWVVATDVEPPAGVTLAPLAKVTGWGPAPDLIQLAEWAAWRWAGQPAQLLRTASPERATPHLPRPAGPAAPIASAPADDAIAALAESALDRGTGATLLRLPPSADLHPVALAACRRGNALVLAPTASAARHVGLRLRRAGVPVAILPREWAQARAGACVVGTRAAAWAPVADLAAVVVLDEHDEGWQQERAPTWHARDVVVERARRAGVPCLLVSPAPSLEALDAGPLMAPPRGVERDGWPMLDVVDRRREDVGRSGLYSERLVQVLRSGARVVCVLNRTGRAGLLACVNCGETARCERCAAAVGADASGDLRCRRCDQVRPPACLACGSGRFKNLRPGVARVREELEALARQPVVEVTATTEDPRLDVRLHVGTEAVLHRLEGSEVVAFLDFDQELLAPRYRAAEEALALLVRAGRLVGGRRGATARGGPGSGRVLVQTRLPDHEVIQAALLGDPGRVADAERARREALQFPPVAAIATVSGAAAPELIERLGRPADVEVLGPSQGQWLLRAASHGPLLDALAATPRPHGRVRVAVDPLRL